MPGSSCGWCPLPSDGNSRPGPEAEMGRSGWTSRLNALDERLPTRSNWRAGESHGEWMAKVEVVLEARSWLGEGPCWHPGEQALYWTDVPGKLLHRWHPRSGEHQKWRMKEMVAAIAVRAKGGLIVA